MIISIEELKKHIATDKSEEELSVMLKGIESLIRAYTHNNFQNRNYRFNSKVKAPNCLLYASNLYTVGDTLQISGSRLNNGLYTISGIDMDNGIITLNGPVRDEARVLVTKVSYPDDIKTGVINMLRWDIDNRDKVGIQSESISRHSVTYFNMDNDNSSVGYPKSLTGFLKPYIKARF